MDSMVTSKDGTSIAYEKFEQHGRAPLLILIDPAGHFRANSGTAELATRLAEDFRVIRYDRRGRGASTDTPPYAPEREVDDLAALIEAQGAPAHLYGHSSGCLVALHAAAAGLPLRRLVLLEPPIEPTTGDPAQREFTRELQQRSGADAVEFFLAAIGVPAEAIDRTSEHWAAMVSVAHTLAYDSLLSEATDAELLSRVTTPALVLDSAGSTGDLTGMAAGAARLLPDATHRSLPGEWHGVPAETLAPAVREFLLQDQAFR